ncbi:TetR/AcrR family transcriptional regulator [Clostridium sartagoforme]|uniref:TetR/AcrR family transcriptional regulator n=1 Tax=Clostridium sartagoforme TaxID=84031 RepID=A0A4S2DFG1_9CLOT|nr:MULTISPECIES: TetR/AcrR family transcriptional regulator [Clostridium]MBS5938192.1 TetR/AcrR family transcriptional regulator [Clostridium sp.]TGY40746.1 TetR/AcrR family transcriptional regulator [Clostridium sartagoforme]
MTQKRKTQTKAIIKNVFTQLLIEKGFNSLTVSDITRMSNINRGTFYLHYVDKYDLLEQLENEIISELTNILLKDSEYNLNNPLELIPYSSILNALYYVKEDFEFIMALIGSKGDSAFIEKFKDIIKKLIESRVNKSNSLSLSMKGIPNDYANEILLSSIISVILLWIRKGGVESPEDIAKIISQAKEIAPYELLI